MVKIIFLNLLRSKYGINQIMVLPGSVESAMKQILNQYPQIIPKDIEESVMFINQAKVMHYNRFEVLLNDGDEVVLTHFVGGG